MVDCGNRDARAEGGRARPGLSWARAATAARERCTGYENAQRRDTHIGSYTPKTRAAAPLTFLSMESATREPRAADAIPDSVPAERTRSPLLAAIVAMRPQEWIKNILVFAGLVFSKQFNDPSQVADAAFTFVAFCAISSAGYLFNDLRDVEHDRRHPDKRHRPIAAGELGTSTAWALSALLTVIAIDVALIGASLEVAGLVALYGVTTVAYSLALKRLVIIDVMTIASLFILRVVAGAVAVEAHASQYLLVCTAMLALFLGFTKRRQEAILEQHEKGESRPVLEHYSIPFLDQMVSMVTATAIISYIIYAINSPFIGSRMLATAPSVLYGIFRYLYLIYDREDTRSTAAILVEDPGMLFAGATWIATAVVMLYVVG
jgi:4-hydroxybenzoate polyprenyltransferase